MCGGTGAVTRLVVSQSGLSPRVRGNLFLSTPIPHQAGSIPACAGEPTAAAVTAARMEVYPRVCGGTVRLIVQAGDCLGLSPRVRGNPGRIQPQCCGRRSIPACAGEPGYVDGGLFGVSVYPRVCGGTEPTRLRHSKSRGLSPRVRGNRPARRAGRSRRRSIPACAGEPGNLFVVGRDEPVYPRVCGGTR